MKVGKRAIRGQCWLVILLAVFTVVLLSSYQLVHSPPHPSQIIFSTVGDPKTFNPALVFEFPHILPFTYEGLVKENAQGELKPALAQSWEISQDGKKIVFLLRAGLKWSDGEALTADDVVFTYRDVYQNPAIPNYAIDFLRIGKNHTLPTVRKLNSRQVEFSLPEPWFPFLRVTKLEVLPAHIFRDSVNTRDRNGNPKFLSMWGTNTPLNELVVNGPYQIETYQPGERLIFRRNPHYWRKDLNGNRQPYLDRLIWKIVDNTDTALLQFRSSGLDFIQVNPDYFSLLKQEEKRGKFKIHAIGPSLGVSTLAFNLNQGTRSGKSLVDPIKSRWFNTVEFRQAVAYAIDRSKMINNVYKGLGSLQNSPLYINSPYYLSEQEGLRVYEYNLQQAKELLLNSGFRYTPKGQLLDEEGNLVRFTLLTHAGNRTLEAMGAQIKQDLSQIGMSVDLLPINSGLLSEKLNSSFDWECSLLTTLVGGAEPNDWANIWLPWGNWHVFNQQSPTGSSAIKGWKVADWEQKIGALYIQAAGEFDQAKRKAIYAETQRITQDYLPLIYLVNPLSMLAVRNHIQGVEVSPYLGTFWNVYEMNILTRQRKSQGEIQNPQGFQPYLSVLPEVPHKQMIVSQQHQRSINHRYTIKLSDIK